MLIHTLGLVGLILGGWFMVSVAVGLFVGRFLAHRARPQPVARVRLEPLRTREPRRPAPVTAVPAIR
jgi:hypothetical protein